MSKEGFAWKDVPVAGGGGDAAMTALKAMVAAGTYPTASQMLGYTVLDYAAGRRHGRSDRDREKEGWDKSVPAALQKFSVYDGKWVAAPVNVHSVNWLWINKAVMDKIGGTEPKTFDELIALLDKAKAAGVIPLALGGQNWQEATMFDSIVLSTGGPEFYKKAFNDLDEESLKSDTMKKSFDNLAKIIEYVDPNFSGRDWNLATAMVIKGDALVQVMGDWAKGEFVAAKKTPGHRLLLLPLPGHRRQRDLQLRHVRHVQRSGRPQGRPGGAGNRHAVEELPVGLQRRQGFGSGPYRRSGYRLRRLRQEGHRRPEGSQRRRHAVRLAGPGLRRTAGSRQRLQGRRLEVRPRPDHDLRPGRQAARQGDRRRQVRPL